MNEAVKHFVVQRVRAQHGEEHRDALVVEEPLEIRLNNIPLAVVMRTPGHDFDLARGFLLTEGVLQKQRAKSKEQTATLGEEIEFDHARDELGLEIPNVVNCHLPSFSDAEVSGWQRHIFSSSSCGLCGRASIDRVRVQSPRSSGNWRIPLTKLQQLPEKLRASQNNFASTGGLHAAGLFSTGGEIVLVREDIGRHNAVDKILGRAIRENKLPLESYGLLVSGRVSFELVQKALLGGIAFVAGISAASSLAVELAEEAGMTLVGFLRGETAVVYANAQRLEFGKEGQS